MFDPDKTYGAVVWDMSIAVMDKDLRARLNQVGLPFDEVDSGAEGIICLAFATDDEEYNDG